MARFEVYAFNGGRVMDLQNDYVQIPGSRVVAPLLPKTVIRAAVRGLHPSVFLDGQEYVVATQMLAATPNAALEAVDIAVKFDPDEITRALDILFQGY
ncbi:MAG: CcdB family protein [Sulfitobacter sp.]